jgi:hypothetical protein
MKGKKKAEQALGITSENARNLVKADLQAILADSYDPETKRLKKALPAGVRRSLIQLAMLDESGEGVPADTWVGNKRALAKAIPVSTPILYRLMKLKGFPKAASNGKYDVLACRAFANQQGYGNAKPPAEDDDYINPKEKAIVERLNFRNRTERVLFGIKMRDFVTLQEANETIATANAIVIREITRIFEHELPALCEGRTAAEIRVLNRERLRDILTKLPKALLKLAPRKSDEPSDT